jgi:hypothetical protein
VNNLGYRSRFSLVELSATMPTVRHSAPYLSFCVYPQCRGRRRDLDVVDVADPGFNVAEDDGPVRQSAAAAHAPVSRNHFFAARRGLQIKTP